MAAGTVAGDLPLVTVVGPTASGKTALAVELAERFGGEIICADSRTVYKYMDIGTAKPTPEERRRVPHWGLDLVEPDERFTAADFKDYAVEKITEIRRRGHVPFLVGGTGLYVDAVLFDYQFGAPADATRREELTGMTVDELIKYCNNNNIILPKNYRNKRHLVRAIELAGTHPQRRTRPISTSVIVGIATNKDELRARILRRAQQITESGVVEEATKLGEKYGWGSEAMTGIIYRLAHQYMAGEINREELIEKSAAADWQLARRQMTWFRRNEHIRWLERGAAREYIAGVLAAGQIL